jgi:STE24 endopeptidase
MRHLKHIGAHRESVPAEFTQDISLDAHRKAADYTCAKTRLGLVTTAFEGLLMLAFTLGGGLQWMHDLTAGWFAPGVLRGIALVGVLAAITTALDLPFAWYRTFTIEQRFGRGTCGGFTRG